MNVGVIIGVSTGVTIAVGIVVGKTYVGTITIVGCPGTVIIYDVGTFVGTQFVGTYTGDVGKNVGDGIGNVETWSGV
jgi:hypothetical protein